MNAKREINLYLPCLEQYKKDIEIGRSVPPPYVGPSIFIGRGFQGTLINVGTTATLILAAQESWPYIILNPSRTVGLTTSGTLYSGTVSAAGNIQATSIGVANYLNMHFHLDVTAITGTWDIYAQTKDPVSGNWADSQIIFAGVTATGTLYASIGMLGSVVDFAVRWVPTAAGSMTFSLSYTSKYGTIGSSGGLAQTVYLGSNDGVSVVSGYPIMEGGERAFTIGEGVELWGIAAVATPIRLFKL